MSEVEYRPQLAALVDAPPAGDAWLHEIKFDGYRIGCRKLGRSVVLLSRKGNDWYLRASHGCAAIHGKVTSARGSGSRPRWSRRCFHCSAAAQVS
jgi:ATP-dependent DNA ligase